MTSLSFAGRVAVVTGAGGTKGREYAVGLADRGASVVVTDLPSGASTASQTTTSIDAVRAKIQERGGRALAVEGDITDAGFVGRLIEATVDMFGQLDILINNAGNPMGPVGTGEICDFRETAEVHFFGCVALTKEVWPHMLAGGYGRIVNTASVAILGLPAMSPYAAAKAAVHGFTRSIAAELEQLDVDVRANCVCPTGPSKGGEVAGRVTAVGNDAETGRWSGTTSPDYPATLYLAHESCRLNGETLTVGENKVTRIVFAETSGLNGRGLSLEDIAEHVDRVMDDSDAMTLRNVDEWNVRRRGSTFSSMTDRAILWPVPKEL